MNDHLEALDENSLVFRGESSSPTRNQWLFFAVACVLTLPAAYFHGVTLRRWGIDERLRTQAAALDSLPSQFGPWTHVADGRPITARAQQQLEVEGYCHRIYEHASTRQRVSLLLLVGPAGPLVRHPPEICYESRDHRLLRSQMIDVDLPDQSKAHFRALSYDTSSPIDDGFLVVYGFGDQGNWDNPTSPRLAYAAKPLLYKLQVLTDASAERKQDQPEGVIDFLRELLVVLNQRTLAGA